jgi:hypothetical protein
MSHIEEAILRRFSGLTLVVFGAGLAVAGVLPLLLYIAVGPEDGNPIGLGLLALALLPTGTMIALAGLIKLLVQYFSGSGE